LPSFLWPRRWFTLIETSVRIGLAALGAWIVTDARRSDRSLRSTRPVAGMHSALAVVLALAAAEVALKYVKLHPANGSFRRRAAGDTGFRLGGYLYRRGPGTLMIGAATSRIRSIARLSRRHSSTHRRSAASDHSLHGRIGDGRRRAAVGGNDPAQVGATLGIQSANLAVHGYSTDQSYMRLETELPRFKRPVAVVTLFMTALFGRNLDRDRPSLGPGLAWRPARPRARLPHFFRCSSRIEAAERSRRV
jgi:hypothetical protein